jgi:hypothetical protein
MTQETLGNGKLLAARAEIEAIFRKHNIAGMVFLHMPGFLEVFSDFSPTYSRLEMIKEGGHLVGVKIQSKLEDYGGDREAQRRDLEATANMTSSMAEAMGMNAVELMQLAAAVDKHLNADHTGLRPVDAPKGSLQ